MLQPKFYTNEGGTRPKDNMINTSGSQRIPYEHKNVFGLKWIRSYTSEVRDSPS